MCQRAAQGKKFQDEMAKADGLKREGDTSEAWIKVPCLLKSADSGSLQNCEMSCCGKFAALYRLGALITGLGTSGSLSFRY